VRVIAADPALRDSLERAVAASAGPAIVTADPGGIASLRASHPAVPILAVLGHRAQITAALDAGADTVALTPLRPAELRARLRTLCRHPSDPRLRVGPVEVDPRARAAWLERSPLALPRRELAVLSVLASAPGQTFTKGELLRACWGEAAPSLSSRTLDRHVSRLRGRLGRHARLLVTVWGVGYRLDEPA